MKHALRMIMWVAAAVWTAGTLSAQTLNLDFSTYCGGAYLDFSYGIALDSMNQVYICGFTSSLDFPTSGAYQSSKVPSFTNTAFLSKFSSSGSIVVYSTYLGGSVQDHAFAVAVDSANRAYVVGSTSSGDFPTADPYQPFLRGGGVPDAFLSRFSSSGSALTYSTYLGGAAWDRAQGIAVDSLGQASIAGYTASTDLPVANAYQSSYGGGAYDAFNCLFSSTGSVLIYSTYLGGSDEDKAYGIDLDPANRACVAGETYSADFPTANAFQASNGGESDAFIALFSSSGSALSYSTYLGGLAIDDGYALVLGSIGEACVTGVTQSSDFPTADAYQSSWVGGWDAFVTLFSSSGSALSYSTYLGGSGNDNGYALVLDPANRAYVAGATQSIDFPTANVYQASNAGSGDAFICQLSSPGSTLVYSTYLGGGNQDEGYGLALDSTGGACVTGLTRSDDFPTISPYQASSAGDYEAFIARLSYSTPEGGRLCDSGDYNGDGTDDIAIYRGSSGMWSVRNLTRVYFGGSTDYIVPADYSGDGTTEIAVWRWSDGLWSVRNLTRFYLGSGNDLPVPGDYSGNGTASAGIFRESNGLWSIRDLTRVYLGAAGDTIVPGYYSPGGAKDIAIFRPSEGLWAIRNLTRIYFGQSSDSLVPGDYNGSGQWAAGVFRRPDSLWAIRDVTRFYTGTILDLGVPADYDGDGIDEAGTFRRLNGLWAIRDLTRVYLGSSGDLPATR